MTEFTDLFSREISSNGNNIQGRLQEFDESDRYTRIRDSIRERIETGTDIDPEEKPSVIACDAGRNSVTFRNNHRFFVAQASAVDSDGGNSRSLKTDLVRPYESRDFNRLMSFSSELAELEAVNDRLDNFQPDGKTFILIDGSLVTRMLPVPTELEVSSSSEIVLDLIDEFHRLLQRVRDRENLVLVGVSKDSNSSILNKAVIEQLSERTLQELEGSDEELAEVYQESIPDISLMDQSLEGYTTPVKIGAASRDFRRRMKAFNNDPEGYVERNFTDTGRALETVEKIREYPGLVSFYWLPGGDQPIRIDLIGEYWDEKSLLEVEDRNFVEPREIMKEVIGVLKAGYAGASRHNVWISQADSHASLSNTDMENIYLPIMSQRLGLNLRNYRRRRDKRV